jgi:hypothetical protein
MAMGQAEGIRRVGERGDQKLSAGILAGSCSR